MPSEIVTKCSKLLIDKNLRVVFAESATGGRLGYEFSMTEKAGQFFIGSLVTYDAGLKQDRLDVSKELIDEFTPESAEVTKAMTLGLSVIVPADIYLSITGLVSPGGSETPEKPVGTIFIHGLCKDREIVDRTVFKGSPEEIVMQAIDRVATLLIESINANY
ncbi:CinA family protein [Pedobacter sp.]|uniref:CinA family protein n=1 Tax=Pedobacter sp. TaxID=1411316 RepID=UPI003D7F3C39